MADISSYLAAIMAAVYGEDVRGSIHDAIDIINKVGEVVLNTGTAVTGPTSSSTGFYTGSFYINTNTMELWKCIGTDAWQSQGTLKGADGVDGNGITSIVKTATVGLVDTYTITFDDGTTETYQITNGQNGSKWYKGTAISGTGTSITGFPGTKDDFYLNSVDGYVYVCVKTGGAMVPDAAEWDYVMTLTGGGGSAVTVIDNLISTSSTDALSANQGRVLKGLVDAKADDLNDLSDVTLTTPTPDQVLKYNGSAWVNATVPSGGGLLPILHIESEDTATVTIADSADLSTATITITPTHTGTNIWEGAVPDYGVWYVHSVLTGQGDAVKAVDVKDVAIIPVPDYHFSATITATFTSGASCTCTDGVTTLTATSNPYTFVVPNVGNWTVLSSRTLDGNTKSDSASVTISAEGQSESVTLSTEFGTINVTVAQDFIDAGSTITCVQSGVTISKPATDVDAHNILTFRVPSTGTWTISGEISGTPYTVDANVSSLSTAVSVNLQTTINVNVTLHGAVGAVITYTDATGAKTQTLNSSGKKTGVAISVMPSSPTITFTDTTVAKNPNNLSANYTKSVTITNGMTDVYVMPDNVMYWYGYTTYTFESVMGSGSAGMDQTKIGSFSETTNSLSASLNAAECLRISNFVESIKVKGTGVINVIYTNNVGGNNIKLDSFYSSAPLTVGNDVYIAFGAYNRAANAYKCILLNVKSNKTTGTSNAQNGTNYTGDGSYTFNINAIYWV